MQLRGQSTPEDLLSSPGAVTRLRATLGALTPRMRLLPTQPGREIPGLGEFLWSRRDWADGRALRARTFTPPPHTSARARRTGPLPSPPRAMNQRVGR